MPDLDLVGALDRILSDRYANHKQRRVRGRRTCAPPPVPGRVAAPFGQTLLPFHWPVSPASPRFPCKRNYQPVRSRLTQIRDRFAAPPRNNGSHYSSQSACICQIHSVPANRGDVLPDSPSVSSPERASLRRLVSLAEPALLARPRCSEN